MFWRIEPLPLAGDDAPLLYDEVRRLLRRGDGEPLRVPHHPALVLSLLLRMHEQGATLSAAQLCAFLELRPGTRVSGHVSELRKKLADCGVGPERVLELKEIGLGYRMAEGVRVARLFEAEVRALLAEQLARAEKDAPAHAARRAQQTRLLEMLALCSAIALAYTGYLRLRPGDEPLPHHEPEEGMMGPRRPCLPLGRDGLADRDVLVVELSRPSAAAPAHVVIRVEGERPQDPAAQVAFDLDSSTSTARIAARDLEPNVRSHARRVCLGRPADAQHESQPGAITLKAVRVE